MEIFKTSFLMVSLMLLFIFVGYYIAGEQGMMIAFLMACATNIFSYFFSDKIVLKHYNAIEVSQSNAKGLYEIVRNLAIKAKTPMPKICIIPDNIPNAFATGRNPSNAVVAVTKGLLDLLDEKEIQAVLAHEMSHVKHYDILTGSIVATFAGAIAMLANFAKFGATFGENKNQNKGNVVFMLILAIIMPIIATIIQMSISRSREYAADRGAAILTQNPQGLIDALIKLENYAKNVAVLQNATPQSAHMFIINPFSGLKNSFSSLFRTHPSTEDRIQALKEIKREMRNF